MKYVVFMACETATDLLTRDSDVDCIVEAVSADYHTAHIYQRVNGCVFIDELLWMDSFCDKKEMNHCE